MIRWLIALVTAAALLWSGWWLVASTLALRATEAGVETLRADGWDIAYDKLSIAGFPNRFDTTVEAPRVTTPDGAVAFAAPFFQVFALSYRPNHLIAIAPPEMAFETPRGRIEITSGDLRGSVVGSGLSEPVLMRFTLAGRSVGIGAGDLGVTLDTGQIATRQAGSDAVHDVALTLSGLALSPALPALTDPGGVLPAAIETVSADAQATLTDAVGMGLSPRLAALDVRAASLAWGDLRLDVEGRLDVAADGTPEGVLTLRAEGWSQALRLAVGLGLIAEQRLPLLTAGLGGMADGDGALTLDLVLADGQMTLGSIPLGPAPRL